MSKTYEFLKKAGTFYLATADADQPRVRPFGAIAEFEGKIYIVTNNQKDVYKQMISNPKVEISGMAEGSWIRLAGTVKEDTRREARVAMLEANPSLANMYNADDNLMTVLYFESATATFCSFTSEPQTETL